MSKIAGSRIATASNSSKVDSSPTCALLKVAADAAATHQDGDAEEQQGGADDRTGNLRLHDLRLRMRQHEQRQHQFGSIAEADIQQAPNGAAGMLGHLLGGVPHPVGQHPDRDETGQENPLRRYKS